MHTTDSMLEDLIGQIGTFGKYQAKQHGLHLLTAILGGLHMLSLRFVAPTPAHRCLIEEIDLNVTSSTNYERFNSSILSAYIPLKDDGSIDSCHKYETALNGSTLVTSCNGQYVYDTSVYEQSRVYEWEMVCENKWQRALIQSIYVFGVLNGALICGALADRLGRKRILCVSAFFQFVFALAGAFITNYVAYCVNIFFYGFFGSGGAFVTGFVLSMELVNKKHRTYCGAAFSIGFATGISLNAFWGYLIRDVTTLQTVLALHSLCLFGHFWLIDESIRWLWGQGRTTDVIIIVKKACHLNNVPFEYSYDDNSNSSSPMTAVTSECCQNNVRSYGLSDLFRKPIIRCRAISMAFLWFSIALCLYGMAFNTGVLPGNPYLVFFLVSIADLPGHFLVAMLVDKTGRRALNSALLLTGGVACIITTFIPRGFVVTSIAMIAKVAMAGCFCVMYNYTAELFPTVVRNSAVGLCSMASRTGGMLAPQMLLLDSLDRRIPTVVFGGVAVIASFVSLFLPETLHKELPQSIEDGENFGRGDSAFSTCCVRRTPTKPQHRRADQNVNYNSENAKEVLVTQS